MDRIDDDCGRQKTVPRPWREHLDVSKLNRWKIRDLMKKINSFPCRDVMMED